jgi:2-keto-4-pentenoate hydratase/2-oxohepta-3-ene-1,7-dioic acid hydratase in catechol pathway
VARGDQLNPRTMTLRPGDIIATGTITNPVRLT